MQLHYVGPAPSGGSSALPLPEGWPASDHDEPDRELAKAKVASGMYEQVKASKAATASTEEAQP